MLNDQLRFYAVVMHGVITTGSHSALVLVASQHPRGNSTGGQHVLFFLQLVDLWLSSTQLDRNTVCSALPIYWYQVPNIPGSLKVNLLFGEICWFYTKLVF